MDTLHLQYFYGNGVFRSTFVGILIGPKASVLQNWFYSWINSGVQVSGMRLTRPVIWPLPCARNAIKVQQSVPITCCSYEPGTLREPA